MQQTQLTRRQRRLRSFGPARRQTRHEQRKAAAIDPQEPLNICQAMQIWQNRGLGHWSTFDFARLVAVTGAPPFFRNPPCQRNSTDCCPAQP